MTLLNPVVFPVSRLRWSFYLADAGIGKGTGVEVGVSLAGGGSPAFSSPAWPRSAGSSASYDLKS